MQKKLRIVTLLYILVFICLCTVALNTSAKGKAKSYKAKTYVLPINWYEEEYETFLKKHKKDNCYMVVKCEVLSNGIAYDKYGIPTVVDKSIPLGTEMTIVFKWKKGTRYWDDWISRSDYYGTLSKAKAMRKFGVKGKLRIIKENPMH